MFWGVQESKARWILCSIKRKFAKTGTKEVSMSNTEILCQLKSDCGRFVMTAVEIPYFTTVTIDMIFCIFL